MKVVKKFLGDLIGRDSVEVEDTQLITRLLWKKSRIF